MTDRIHEILIVESDQPTVELYTRELSREYHVLTSATEREVLHLLNTRTISAIVLEPASNGGEGRQILAAISPFVRDHSIPIILCSTLDQRGRGLDAGVAAYLVKPTLPTALRDTLRQVIWTH